MKAVLKTDKSNVSYFIIRVIVAGVILPHGLQKLFGFFDGYGFNDTVQYFTRDVGMPWILGFLVIIAESFGMLLLMAGVLSRLVAVALIFIMTGAAFQHYENGFFMNWFGTQAGEGVEFFILAIGMALIVAINGPGKWSVDGWMAEETKKELQTRASVSR